MHLFPVQIRFLVLPNLMPADVVISVPSGALLQIYPFILFVVGNSVHKVIYLSKSRRKMKKTKVCFHFI